LHSSLDTVPGVVPTQFSASGSDAVELVGDPVDDAVPLLASPHLDTGSLHLINELVRGGAALERLVYQVLQLLVQAGGGRNIILHLGIWG
jgi:hypothetical protein